jgi:hypothetical protein
MKTYCIDSMLNHCAANRKRWLSALPNLSPYTQERVTAVMRSIPKEAFTDSFQKLYERCQPYVVKDGDYFEGQ